MLDHEFGGDWTDNKLAKVRAYLPAYIKVLSDKGFKTGYIDAFAGTGYRTSRPICQDDPGLFEEIEASDAQNYSDGSARIALMVEPAFDKYIFIEKDPEKCSALLTLKNEFPALATRVEVCNGDANDVIARMCSEKMDWSRHRAVMFLDPYGMQVEWKTVELVAATKAIDLWYNFPLGPVNRLLEKRPGAHAAFEQCLDRVLGSTDWRIKFYNPKRTLSLFEDENERLSKDVTFQEIGAYIIERLKTIFPGVVEEPYILKNSKNSPLFMLCFAVGNPNPKARDTALKIARHILTKD